jgi:hypothetical protein
MFNATETSMPTATAPVQMPAPSAAQSAAHTAPQTTPQPTPSFASVAASGRGVDEPSPPPRRGAQGVEPAGSTRAWRVQVWLSFGLAVALCAIGLAWLPGADLDRAFMVMGYLFCLCTAFGVAKQVRDVQQPDHAATPMWSVVVWGGFALALALTGWGLWRMAIEPVWKAYLGVAWLFLISAAFTLAKTLRDDHEQRRARG